MALYLNQVPPPIAWASAALRIVKSTPQPGQVQGVRAAIGRKPIAVQPVEGLEIEVDGETGPKLRPTLGPEEPHRLTLHAILPDEELAVRALDVIQTQGGKVLGGARVLVVTLPDELLRRQPRDLDRGD